MRTSPKSIPFYIATFNNQIGCSCNVVSLTWVFLWPKVSTCAKKRVERIKHFLTCIYCAKSVNIRTKHVCAVTYSSNHHCSNLISLAVHLLVSPTQALCSNPGHQPKGNHVPLGWCVCQDSNPALDCAPVACFGLFFLWLWLVKSQAT